jgi:predicted HTH domain antitoxin
MTTDRTQVNIRLERQLLEELDEMALEETVDRAELARRLLRDGLKRERVTRAMRRYREGEVSAARAAEEARISLYEMLDRIRAEGIPYELDADELDRIDATIGTRRPTSVNERVAQYAAQKVDAVSSIDALRTQFQPKTVRWLFVGESSPAGGTHFYRANSNLFRAMREAFARAFGEEVPSGPAFLHFFRERGAWLVDLADRPVNRLEDRERAAAVVAGIERLASVISAAQPERIFVVKASIESTVREAAQAVSFDGDVVVLPFPIRQWRAAFIRKLAAELVPD